MKPEEADKHAYGAAGYSFTSNISAVRVLGLEIGRLGDEHDEAVAKKFVQDVAKLIPGFPPAHNADLRISVSFEAEFESPATDLYGMPSRRGHTPHHHSKLEINDPEQAALLLRALKAFTQRLPVQGVLLRNGALITLVSFFENLISELLHAFYHDHPQALPAESRSLSLSDLRAFGSIQDAEQFLTSKEVDSLLRESLDEQLTHFSKRLQVDLSPLDALRNELAEVFQRRNLLVHNSGVVNRYYLERVASDLLERYGAKEGKRLVAGVDYLKTAIDVVHSSGLVLLQQCWRKWDKAGVSEADSFLIDQLYESLLARNFDLTVGISEYALRVPFSSDQVRRIAVMNAAIAYKELDRLEDMQRVLQGHDWTACSLKFQVALAALQDENDRLYKLLPKAVAAGEITKENLREWPLFARHRQTERFNMALEQLPPEPTREALDAPSDLAS